MAFPYGQRHITFIISHFISFLFHFNFLIKTLFGFLFSFMRCFVERENANKKNVQSKELSLQSLTILMTTYVFFLFIFIFLFTLNMCIRDVDDDDSFYTVSIHLFHSSMCHFFLKQKKCNYKVLKCIVQCIKCVHLLISMYE